ncbi:MAG: MATE family efflux transporter [Ruminococcaceae bacterium]|nr:MATE family efflux transporter [Oscillospiraceae bacterium]
MFGKQTHRDFTEGKILPQIFWFAIPLMITGILQLLFNTADTVMVGRWGGNTPEECETALAAVGSCGALINLIIMLFMNLSLGSGVCVAHDIGAKNYEGVKKTVHTSVILALLCGIIVMPVGIIGSRFFLDLMGTEEVVLDSAVPYMRAYFVGVPANMLYNYCASILRSAGETTRPMKYLLISGVVNVGLNAVMIFAFNLGALGVGIASAASFYLSCILIIRHMLKTDAPYRLDYKKMAIDKEKLKSILLIGIPAGIQGLICSVANVMIQSTVNSFGKAVVAGNSAAANIEGYIYQPIAAFYHAAVTFVGQHKGARKYTRMKQCIYRCVACVAIVSILSGAVTVLAGKFLLGIYVPENEGAIAAGMTRVYICATTYFMCGLAEVGSGILRGLGRSTTSMTISLTSGVALRILWLLFIFPLNPKLYMLYIAFPTAWILNALAHFILAAINVRQESLNSID